MPKCDDCAWPELLRDLCVLEPTYPNGCPDFIPRRKPLVDELAEVTRALMVELYHVRDHDPDCICDEDCLEWARTVLCRHDKEKEKANGS